MQTALSIVTAIDELQEDPGADKAGQLADILSNLTSLSQLLTTLSLNPVIGVFIGLYATALKSAMIPIQIIADQVAIRGEVIESSTAGIDIEAELAEQDAAAESAADAQLAVSEQLSALHARRSELIADLQGGQYVVALDFAASRHPDEMRELISIASEQGGITSDAAVNGETLGQIETWVGSATEASFDLMTEAAAAPEGSEARADAIESLDTLNDARHRHRRARNIRVQHRRPRPAGLRAASCRDRWRHSRPQSPRCHDRRRRDLRDRHDRTRSPPPRR